MKKNFLIDHLKDAIKNNEFKLVYQPIFNLNTNKVVGAEALLRWRNSAFGNINPEKFLKIAQQINYMNVIDLWVVKKAFFQINEWMKKNPKSFKNFFMLINIDLSDIQNIKFNKSLIKFSKKYAIPHKNFILEITEHSLMKNIKMTSKVMKTMSNLGIHFAIDDFGFGRSSLYYLKNLPVDFIKIDQKFLKDIPGHKPTAQIIDTIIKLGKILNFKVISEGINLSQQLNFLKRKKCRYGQGFYLSKPLTPERFEEKFFQKEFSKKE